MEQIFLPDNNGFLGKEFQPIVNKIKITYKDWFILIEQINNLVYEMYNNFDIPNNDEIAMFLITSFSKVHKSFQTCSILYSYGLEDDTHIIFRTMLESLFVSASIKKDKTNFKKLLKNQYIEDNQKINNLIDYNVITDKKKTSINIREKTSIHKFAQQTQYKDMYIAYSYLSSYIHVDLRNLEKDYDIKNNEVTSICIAPSTKDLCFILTEVIGLMLAYIDLIKDYLSKDYNDCIKRFKIMHIHLQSRNK